MEKREFLKKASIMGFSVPLTFDHLNSLIDGSRHLSDREVAQDESFWLEIRKDYRLKPDYINLENGYYCVMPQSTESAYIEHLKEINYQGSWYMRTVQFENKKVNASLLAEMAGCSQEELVITRNTTESLDMIIQGQDWMPGDEAIMSMQDYGAMLNQFKMMEKRFGIICKELSIPNHPNDDDEIVNLYRSAITPKTKLLMVCHMVNITGQILPVRKICDMAHELGVLVMVDGAHAFGHFQFSINELNCDYYATSLHKWLSVPLGAGFLFVKKGKVSTVWPIFAEGEMDPNDILRLNHIGTHPAHTDLAIVNAINYHQKIGGARKEARLRFLQRYWTTQVRDLPRVEVNTPVESYRHCAIGNVGIAQIPPNEFAKRLLDEFKIWTVAIDSPGVRGLRITPNVYTTTSELDTFVEAIKQLSA